MDQAARVPGVAGTRRGGGGTEATNVTGSKRRVFSVIFVIFVNFVSATVGTSQ
jgi:hypothetical protein